MAAVRSLTAIEARRLRLASLLLAGPAAGVGPADRSPAEVARWMGALQGQDLASVQWSFGRRRPGSTLVDVEAALASCEVLRTWPMRGTVHAIAPEDARWMLATCGVRALQGVEKRWERLGLDRPTVEAAAELLDAELAGGRRLTRSACVELLAEAGLHTASGHGYHLLWYASQVGITCIGPNEGSEQTFVRLADWAPDQRQLEGEEALAVLAERFVRGHGPVTRQDLAGWAGITQGAAKAGIAAAGPALVEVEVDSTPMVASAELVDVADAVLVAHAPRAALLLPGFDELVLGVKDRSLILEPGYLDRIVPGSNGMFLATVVVDGRVVGTWRRTIKRTARDPRVEVDVELFEPQTKAVRAAVAREAAGYGAFLGLDAVVEVHDAGEQPGR